MKNGIKNGCDSVEFIGGEVSIRPDVLSLVREAKKIGYKHVSMETNGRMFANPKFTKAIVSSGLDVVLFSLHGHKSTIHDCLTNSPNSFSQAIRGIKEVQKHKSIIVNTNMVITKVNYLFIKEYLTFLSHFNINSKFLSFVNPIVNTICNSKEIVPMISEVAICIKDALSSNTYKRVVIQNIPFCFFKNVGYNLSNSDSKSQVFISLQGLATRRLSKELKRLKTKIKKCKNCPKNNFCDGIWKNYISLYGTKELETASFNCQSI
jgi:MoaA/NifB/PqqE/SkfB family radical SAM enzyme